jgi:hypothetical protein
MTMKTMKKRMKRRMKRRRTYWERRHKAATTI